MTDPDADSGTDPDADVDAAGPVKVSEAGEEFDPEKFEDKYEHYFPELQTAYREAFDHMNDRHDSELVHAIDQGVLAESEPFYEGDGQFRIELPDDPVALIAAQGVLVDDDEAAQTVAAYVDRLEAELRSVFGFDDADANGDGDQ